MQMNPDILLAAVLAVGLCLFLWGLSLYNKQLLFGDTRPTPVRGVAMGLVRVRGIAGGPGAFPSPISGIPCYAFKVKIDRRHAAQEWSHYRTDQNGMKFCLDDGTGQVTVDPRSAEFDLPRQCRRQVPSSVMFDDEADIDPADIDAWMTLAPEPRTDQDLLSWAGEPLGSERDCFRFLEYCILPGHQYEVLGTCSENPRPQNGGGRNLITKGENESTFMISARPSKVIEQRMGWKAAVIVWGGAAMAVAAASMLLAQHGFLW